MKKANSAAPAVPRRPGVGALSKGKLLRRLWRYLGRNRLLLVLALTLSVSSSLLSLYGPKLSGQAINAIDLGAGKVDFDTVFRCAALMAVFYLLSAVLTYLLNAVMIRLSRRVSRQMRHDVFENLAALPVSFFDRYQTGDIISTITYDVDTVNQSLSSDLLQILQSVVTVVVSFIMMLTIAPKLVLIFVVTIPVTVLFTRWLAGRVRPMFRRRSAKLGVLNGYVEEMLSGQKTVRAYGQEAAVLAGFDEKNRDAVDAYTVAESYGTITGPSVNFINNVSLSLVCIFGSVLFLRGEIGLGDLSSFVQYSRKFSGPINEVANIIAELQSAFAAAERVFGLIDAAPEPADAPDAEELTRVAGDVRLEQVDFSYTPGVPIIQNLNLHAAPGSLTAIVGPTGAGKTTIINLLMRFYDVDGGRITLDGRDIRNLTRSSLRKAYSMVLQDTHLAVPRHDFRQHRLRQARRHHGGRGEGRQGRPYPLLHLPAAGGISDGAVRQRLQHFQGAEAAADHRPGHAARRPYADSGRGHLQRGHPDRTRNSGRHADADGGKNLLRHRPPALHHPRCGPHSGAGRRPGGGAGHPRQPDGPGRLLPQAVRIPV